MGLANGGSRKRFGRNLADGCEGGGTWQSPWIGAPERCSAGMPGERCSCDCGRKAHRGTRPAVRAGDPAERRGERFRRSAPGRAPDALIREESMVTHVDVDVPQLWRDYRAAPTLELRNQLVELYLPLVRYNAERIWARAGR